MLRRSSSANLSATHESRPHGSDALVVCVDGGFNDYNLHPRRAPCDQDFLRKLARGTKPDELEDATLTRKVDKQLGADSVMTASLAESSRFLSINPLPIPPFTASGDYKL